MSAPCRSCRTSRASLDRRTASTADRSLLPPAPTGDAWVLGSKQECIPVSLSSKLRTSPAPRSGRWLLARVFRYCKPDVILASDKSVMYDTQIVDYGQHARGILWTTNTGKQIQRSFLTTRNDGTLGIAPRASTYYIQASG